MRKLSNFVDEDEWSLIEVIAMGKSIVNKPIMVWNESNAGVNTKLSQICLKQKPISVKYNFERRQTLSNFSFEESSKKVNIFIYAVHI